jgi:hypothetical protein
MGLSMLLIGAVGAHLRANDARNAPPAALLLRGGRTDRHPPSCPGEPHGTGLGPWFSPGDLPQQRNTGSIREHRLDMPRLTEIFTCTASLSSAVLDSPYATHRAGNRLLGKDDAGVVVLAWAEIVTTTTEQRRPDQRPLASGLTR